MTPPLRFVVQTCHQNRSGGWIVTYRDEKGRRSVVFAPTEMREGEPFTVAGSEAVRP